MSQAYPDHLQQEIDNLSAHGLCKNEPVLASAQSASIGVEFDSSQRRALNYCANYYPGLADNHQIIELAKKAFEEVGEDLGIIKLTE